MDSTPGRYKHHDFAWRRMSPRNSQKVPLAQLPHLSSVSPQCPECLRCAHGRGSAARYPPSSSRPQNPNCAHLASSSKLSADYNSLRTPLCHVAIRGPRALSETLGPDVFGNSELCSFQKIMHACALYYIKNPEGSRGTAPCNQTH